MHISFPASSAPDDVSVIANLIIPNTPLPITTLSITFLFFLLDFAIFSSKNPSGICPEFLIIYLSKSFRLFSNKYKDRNKNQVNLNLPNI